MSQQKPPHCPSMSGSITAHKPQWRHDPAWGPAINKRLGLEGGEDWTDVQVTIVRGGIVLRAADGSEFMVGVPFPRLAGGVLETIHLYGYEQSQALAWWFAASAQAAGATIEVRVVDYQLNYDIKARELEQTSATESCK